MRFKSATIKEFKRFTNLTVQGVPATARLIMLAGPNGSGKSSFFDALLTWHGWTSRKHRSWEIDYHVKAGSLGHDQWQNDVQVEFHVPVSDPKKTFFVRSAYRNDPDFQVHNLQQVGDPLDEIRAPRMIDNDGAVAKNFRRLVSQAIEDVFDPEDGSVTLDVFKESVIGDIRAAITGLFPDIELDSLGNPLEDGTFRFTKGASKGFSFKNLSGGEKAVFDLVLDFVVAKRAYNETVFCIDEPEAHMNARLQAELLSVLYGLIPEGCQLMLATHSIGMMRRARDIEAEKPGSVVFLDFGGREFDEPVVIEPTVPDRAFWNSTYEVALDYLAALVAPERVVICEGEPKSSNSGKSYSHDARCYERIFETAFPETQFIPGGNASEVAGDKRGIAYALGVLTQGSEVVKLIDRDSQSPEEIAEMSKDGVRVLSRRNLESYLFDDEVLRALALSVGKADKSDVLMAEKKRILDERTGDAPDDLKPASGQIYNACKSVLQLANPGNNARTFMRDRLALLIKPGMTVYDDLKRDVFGLETGTDDH